jgi:hypothetical protein
VIAGNRLRYWSRRQHVSAQHDGPRGVYRPCADATQRAGCRSFFATSPWLNPFSNLSRITQPTASATAKPHPRSFKMRFIVLCLHHDQTEDTDVPEELEEQRATLAKKVY